MHAAIILSKGGRAKLQKSFIHVYRHENNYMLLKVFKSFGD